MKVVFIAFKADVSQPSESVNKVQHRLTVSKQLINEVLDNKVVTEKFAVVRIVTA